jgi:fermentation-respiration switch protein FrsA (DUF1100 family)
MAVQKQSEQAKALADREKLLAEKDKSIAELENQLLECRRQVVEQGEIIRKHTLSTTARSVDELLAFFPMKFPAGDWRPAEARFRDCWFQASDGIRLHGWYLPHEHPTAIILIMHGNGGNVTSCGPVAQLLHDKYSASVMIFDYRGYGRSEGTPTVEGVLRDARAARIYLAKVENTSEGQIVLLGESLGGAVAVDLAAKDGARGLILDSTFSSLREVAAVHYPKVLSEAIVADRFNSLAKIKQYHGPVLQSHGDRDQTVPIELARKLFAAANEPKRFVLVPGGGHLSSNTEEYYRALAEFIGSLDHAGQR